MAENITKKVLVEHEEDTVHVSFVSGGDMGDFKAVTEAAAIQLAVSPADLVLKIQSDKWGGRWVNIGQNEIIPNKTILRAVIRKSTKVVYKFWWCLLYFMIAVHFYKYRRVQKLGRLRLSMPGHPPP